MQRRLIGFIMHERGIPRAHYPVMQDEQVIGDVTNLDDVNRMFDATLEAFGTVDILVNNAQTPLGRGESGPFLRMTVFMPGAPSSPPFSP